MPKLALSHREAWQELVDLHKKMEGSNGKPKAAELARLKAVLIAAPDLWRLLGDMGNQAEQSLIHALDVPESARESMRVGIKVLRNELGHGSAAPLEKMLIDHVTLAWLRLSIIEFRYPSTIGKSIGIPQADFWDRTLSAAQRRYLRAVETLARVRRLLGPTAVQVNIGARQVNIIKAESGKSGADANKGNGSTEPV
jgi:hypothetical protein